MMDYPEGYDYIKAIKPDEVLMEIRDLCEQLPDTVQSGTEQEWAETVAGIYAVAQHGLQQQQRQQADNARLRAALGTIIEQADQGYLVASWKLLLNLVDDIKDIARRALDGDRSRHDG